MSDSIDENKSNLNIWISKEVKDKLKKQAKTHGRLFGKYIQMLLKEGLELHERDEENE